MNHTFDKARGKVQQYFLISSHSVLHSTAPCSNTKYEVHTRDVHANLISLLKPCLILDLGGLEICLKISYSNFD